MGHIAAVLTGDLIGSTRTEQASVDAAMDAIRSVALNEAELGGADIRFERFRGDGWQIYSRDATRVFRLTLLVLANLQSRPDLPKTRISAATGLVAFMPETGLASASGEAFSVSGQTLDGMTTQRLMFKTEEYGSPWKSALFSYLDWQSSRWSPEQAEAIAIAFRFSPPKPRSVAETLGISRQAAQSRLSGAGFIPLSDTENAFHSIPV